MTSFYRYDDVAIPRPVTDPGWHRVGWLERTCCEVTHCGDVPLPYAFIVTFAGDGPECPVCFSRLRFVYRVEVV